MANYQKLQVGTAINIVPSNDANIPFPNVITESANTGVGYLTLRCENVDFIALNVQVGDIVYNNVQGTAATVDQVIDEHTLLLNGDIFPNLGEGFTIYANNGKEGCVLYVGTGGDLHVVTVSGQDVTFVGILGGSFLPVQVLKVYDKYTTASNIVALW